MSQKIKSPKISGKEYVNYLLAYKYPYWEKFVIPEVQVKKVPPNTCWIVHWWRPTEELTDMEKFHLDVFKKAKPLFKKIIVFYASECPIPPELSGCYVVRIHNDISRGENASFVEAMAQALLGNCDYVFRSHFKARKNYDHFRMKNCHFWCYLMYNYCLDMEPFDSIINSAITCSDRSWLDPYIASLPGKLGELADVHYEDHPCGSYWYINCKRFKEWADKHKVTLDDIKRINEDDVQAKPWLVEVLPTALFRECPSPYYIRQSPYHIYDRFILEGRTMNWAIRRNP